MKSSFLKDYCAIFLNDTSHGAQIFLHEDSKNYSYKELIKNSLSIANFFKKSPDDFFVVKMESSFKLFSTLLGAIFAQKKVLILSNKEPSASVAKIKESVLFQRILTDNDLENLLNFDFLTFDTDPNLPAFFIMSSGTSGPAKAIPLSLNNVFYSAESVINFFKMTSTDTSFSNLPHHHIGGLMIFWRAFFSGGKVTKDHTDKYQFVSLVPLQLQRILEDEEKVKKLQECRGVLIGGAPLIERIRKKSEICKIRVFETYGMSETCSLVMLNGRPLEGQTVLLDPDGYFLIKGKTLSAAAPVDVNGLYHTNDIGVENADGSLSFKHRGDLLFKSAGELINPLLLESRAKELPWISEAIVVPVKHHEWTQAAVMIYQTSDATKQGHDLKEILKNDFHPHLIPKYFIEAPKDLFHEGIKPRRFEITHFAQEQYFRSLFNYHYIPHSSSKNLMVFFHGFMEDHSDMLPLIDSHLDTSYLLIDLPGHGRTTANNFKNRSSVFAELYSLINFYDKSHSLFLYGYSMGGRIALELTLMGLSPKKLILESAHFGLNNEEKKQRLDSDSKLFNSDKIDLSVFFEAWYKNPIFGKYNKSSSYVIDVQKKIYHDTKEWQKSLEFFSPGKNPYNPKEIIEDLSRQDIIGIVGSEDHKYEEHYKELKNKLPKLSIKIIKDSGHNPHKTNAEEIKKILINCM